MKLNLSFAVAQLLRENDCVIVPDFGGFITEFSDAKIDLISLEMSPPAKVIAFNRDLNSDDNLLISYVSKTENISLAEAKNEVAIAVESINKSLSEQKKFVFGNLGFFLMTENGISFSFSEEINLLNSSFGLNKFSFPMLKRHSEISLQKKASLSKSKSSEKIKKKRSATKLIVAISSSAAIIAVLAFATFYFNLFDGIYGLQSAKIATFNAFTGENDFNPEARIDNILETQSDLLEESDYDVINDADDFIAESDFQEIETVSPDLFPDENLRNHIIAGSFSNKTNAEKLQRDFINSGYNSLIFSAPNGMYRVSVKSYANRNDAINNLSTLRSELNNEDLWVFIE